MLALDMVVKSSKILIDVAYGKLDTTGLASSKVFCNANAKGHADAWEPGVLQSRKNLAEPGSPRITVLSWNVLECLGGLRQNEDAFGGRAGERQGSGACKAIDVTDASIIVLRFVFPSRHVETYRRRLCVEFCPPTHPAESGPMCRL